VPLPKTPFYVVAGDGAVPDVTVVAASASGSRVAQQAVSIGFSVRARGGQGSKTTVRVEDGGLTVASATHEWTGVDETWRGTLSYLPAGAGPARLRVEAGALAGEAHLDDNAVDLLAPAVRGPIRTLVLEPAVTWPAVFVRRALEAAPGFAVSAVQRATKVIATRAGSPPRTLAQSDLAPYEVVVVGQPDSLDAAAIDVLRWFVERRGGVAVVVPDQAPKRAAGGLLGDVVFESKTLDRPIVLPGSGPRLMAAELAVPKGLSPLASSLASDSSGTPIVFAMRRGLGAVIVSGALDAWRYRDRDDSAFARFWLAAVLEQAGAVPPLLEVTAVPALARPGDAVHVTVRLRETDVPVDPDRVFLPALSLRAVDPLTRRETAIRVWPSAEPGVFEGEWHPAAAGDYVLDASMKAFAGAALVQVAADVRPPPADADALAIAARATGGLVLAGADPLVRALDDRFPARFVTRPSHPARSAWCAVLFAMLLSAEWALRRRRGMA
jgi:hypothetical protein